MALSGDLKERLARLRANIEPRVAGLAGAGPAFVLFLSFTDLTRRAITVTATGDNFDIAWNGVTARLWEHLVRERIRPCWLRVDWVEQAEEITWRILKQRLTSTKRNYFRYGLSLDRCFANAFLEGELNANAMLYGGPGIEHAVVNEANFARYARLRHGLEHLDFSDDRPIIQFSAKGAFMEESGAVHWLAGAGPDASRRIIERLQPADIRGLIERGSHYLATQVGSDGRFTYGWHPCFDREIRAYNALRHASTLYAMLEAWEVTRDPSLFAAIDRGLSHLTEHLIRTVDLCDEKLAVLVEANGEIKLGGNAVCLLALCKHAELTGSTRYHSLLEQLALAVCRMQDSSTGRFDHVLTYPGLAVKEPFRIIYYDGEAAFGLMRLYALTRDPRWLAAVERAFDYFLAHDHWRAHDHWLAYATNELSRHRPRRDYYEFGLRNFADHLDFVRHRITTFPTLLELMMAARQMLDRLAGDPAHAELLARIDPTAFHEALEHRAHYLLNGHFWPELAMFYANPRRIAGSFFIRHHAFRVRIDDVEHYLSGLVAYLNYREGARQPPL